MNPEYGANLGPLVSLPAQPMGGVAAAKRYVASFLEGNLAAVNASMRPILGVSLPADQSQPNLLPDPDRYFAYEPPALDADTLATSPILTASSLIYVGCTNTPRLELVNFDLGSNPVWDVSYAISIACWVKGFTWWDTIAARDNLTTSVRACLLAAGGLAAPSVMRLDQNSIREQFLWPEVIRGNRHIAAGGVNVILIVRETLDLANLGIVEQIDVTEEMLPEAEDPNPLIHPALED